MRKWALWGLMAVAGVAAAGTDRSDSAALGRQLFFGEVPLSARLRTNPQALPPSAVRCANCHASSRDAQPFGPPLTRESLLGLMSRRGGPPTAYTRDTFCSVLANGVDVAHVVLASAMPQYRLSDAECSALWAFLLTR